jgi:N-acetylneuraminic acid mutarotase
MKKIFHLIIPFIVACLLLGLYIFLTSFTSQVAEAGFKSTPTNSGWNYLADLPIPLAYQGGDTIDGKIYVAGGNDFNQTYDTLFSYDPISDTWQALESLPVSRNAAGTVAEGGMLYVAGGQHFPQYALLKDFYAYSPGTNHWQRLADLPDLRLLGSMAAWQGKLYYVGGMDPSVVKDTVYEYTIISDTWRLLTTLPEGRSGPGATVVDGILYVIGGQRPSGQSDSQVWAYDLDENTWTIRTPMPVAKYMLNSSTKSTNGKIYVVAGWTDETGERWDVEQYDPLTDTWQYLTPLPKPATGVTAAILGGKLHAIGGFNNNTFFMVDHTVLDLPTPPNDVSITGVEIGKVNTSYIFSATVEPISTTLPLTYLWQAEGQSPITHNGGLTDAVAFTWDLPGTQLITITASNIAGSVTDTYVISITDQPIEALTASNDSPSVLGEVTTFTATITSGTNVIFTWDFGDDSYGSGETITHTYTIAGVYTATITATNSVGSLAETTQVSISTPAYPIYLPLTIKSSSGILSPTQPSPLLKDGEWMGLVIVGIVGMWKRKE